MRRWERRNNESVMWALFAAGGQVAVLLLPALVLGFGFLVPLGVFGDAGEVYSRLAGVLLNPWVSLVVLGVLALILWHCFHRGYHALHDLQMEPPEIVRAATYTLAIAIPAGAWAVILWVSGGTAG